MTSETLSPGSTTSLRAANLKRVLDLLRVPGDDVHYSQAELARSTGLAAGTVSSIVKDLSEAELVEIEPGSGRRGTVVRLARGAGLVAGIDVGHSHLTVALGDVSSRSLTERRVPIDADHDHRDALKLADELIADALDEVGHSLDEVRTIGLGLPAPVTDRVVQTSAILPGWVGINPIAVATQQFHTEQFQRPVLVDNDANLGALAEHRIGVARGEDHVVYVKASSGVGAGVVIDGQVIRGARGSAGEIGHLTLNDQGPVCRCGSRGCLEAYSSAESVAALFTPHRPGATIDDVVAEAAAGNVAASRLIEDAGLYLGWGMASVVNLLNPGAIVIGGELTRAGEPLLESIRTGLRRHALADAASTPVKLSDFGDRASALGALIMAAEATELSV